MQSRILIAVTGASGSLYALRLAEVLVQQGMGVDFIFSKAALLVIATETELQLQNPHTLRYSTLHPQSSRPENNIQKLKSPKIEP